MQSEALVNAIGTAAGLCSMASFVPQLVKIAREKRAVGVSLRTYVVNTVGFVLWVTYGVLLGSWPIVGSNAVNLVLAASIMALRWRYGEDEGGLAAAD